MNCRFCGTIVPAPPCDCPKCGRPISAADFTRAADQAAVATIVYRQENRAQRRSGPVTALAVTVIVGVAVTVAAVMYARYARTTQTAATISSPAQPMAANSQDLPKPSPGVIGPEIPTATKPTAPRATQQPEEELVSSSPNNQELVEKAQSALSRGNWIEPPQDNALKWAREARQYGSKEGERIEEQIYKRMLDSVESSRSARDYVAALEQVNQMIILFPHHTSLPALRTAIQRELRGGRQN